MGRRVRQPTGGGRALECSRAVVARPDHPAAVSELRQFARCAVGGERHPHGAARRDFFALDHAHPVQRVCGNRFRRAVRHCRHGRHFDLVLLPLEPGIRPKPRGCHAANLPHAVAAGDDDLHRGLRRPFARGIFQRHRIPGAAAAGAGRRRRHAARSRADPAGAAGSGAEILPRSGTAGRITAGRRHMMRRAANATATAAAAATRTATATATTAAMVRRTIVSCAAIGLGACVGPNFHRPAPPRVERFTSQALPGETASAAVLSGAAQKFLDQDVPRNWWTLFGSEELNALVAQALRANPDVLSAQAALRQALENTAAQRGAFFPTVQAGFDASRNLNAVGVLAPNLASGTALYNLFTPQVTVSYVPDIFGANRRQVESLAAQAEATRFQLDATYLTLTANAVTAAIQEAGFTAQIAATERVISLEGESLSILKHELDLGPSSEVDVYAQEAALAQLQATLPPLRRQLETTRDQLAVLTGHFPAQFQAPDLALDQLVLPTDLPLGVASQLVERRPDVRAAEAQLHSATAQVGVATANLLPQFTITADIGSPATAMSDLFKAGTGFWSIGGTATQTLFAGGTLVHRKRAADAALDQAGAMYQSAVLTAFQNVADALHALDTDADALNAAGRAESAAQKSLDVTRHQLELGSVSYLALLLSEQAYQQTAIALIQARANRFADTAALFQALGGSVTPPPK